MPRRLQVDLPLDPHPAWFDRSVEWAFALVLAFMPLALGVVARWSEEVVLISVAALGFLVLLGLILRGERSFVWSWSYVFVVLFIAVAAAQLLEFPTAIVRAVSPNTVSARVSLLGDLAVDGHPIRRMPISFCQDATRHDLAIVLLCSAVFVIALNVFRRADQIKRLLAMLTVIGGCIVVLALAQDLLEAKAIYWQIQTPDGMAKGGPFINHNDFAQYANLSAGATLALLCVHLREVAAGRGPNGWRLGFPAVSRLTWMLCGLLLATLIAVALSLSRGGIIAALSALAFTIAMLTITRGNSRRGAAIALLGIAAFGCVLYFGFDAVYDRFDSSDAATYGNRKSIFEGVVKVFRMFPSLGTGLGTHQFVFPMVDISASGTLPTHAENEYAQLAEEMGLVGLLLVGGFVFSMGFHYFQSVRRNKLPISAAAFGIGFGLVAVMVHSSSDFGQHFPALGCLSAVSCAVLVNLSRLKNETKYSKTGHTPFHRRFVGRRGVGCAMMAVVVAALVYELPAADRARRAEAYWAEAEGIEWDLASNQWNGSERDYSQLLIKAAAAVDLCPDNVQYAYALNSYRWHSVEAFYDRQSPQYEEFARRIVTELDRSRFLCPTFGPIYCLSGQIEMFVLNRSEGAADIRTGYRLAPSDASCCFAVGRLDANCERWDESLDAFTRAMKLDSSTTPLIMDVYLNQANRPDLAIAILHDDWDSLFHLAQELNAPANASRDPNPAMADVAKKRAVAALERAAASPAASASVVSNMAEIALQRGEYRSAADLFRRAISMNYANAEWHLKLARSLAKLGQGQNAYREARIASQVRPGWVDASRLVDELAKLPGVQGNAE